MYAIYYSDSHTDGKMRLFGVVKYEAVAIEFAKIISFERRWRRYKIRYCRPPYLDGPIPQFVVFSFKSMPYSTYFGFFPTLKRAHRFYDYMSDSYPEFYLNVGKIIDNYEL